MENKNRSSNAKEEHCGEEYSSEKDKRIGSNNVGV
jgi:hypothetical protein